MIDGTQATHAYTVVIQFLLYIPYVTAYRHRRRHRRVRCFECDAVVLHSSWKLQEGPSPLHSFEKVSVVSGRLSELGKMMSRF